MLKGLQGVKINQKDFSRTVIAVLEPTPNSILVLFQERVSWVKIKVSRTGEAVMLKFFVYVVFVFMKRTGVFI